jgi:hypothetical protein
LAVIFHGLLFTFFIVGFEGISPKPEFHRIVHQDVPSTPMLMVGEELEYSVRYSFFDIGTIRLRILSKEVRGDRPVYRSAIYMDSDPGLSWLLSLHIRFFGLMDSTIYSHTWVSEDSTSDGVDFRSMVFDYEKRFMYYTKGERNTAGQTTVSQNDTILIGGPSQDGLTLFFFAREYARSSWQLEVPTFMDTTEGLTQIRFTGETRSVEVDAVPYPVETVYFDGTADFVGVFGVTGEYEGWFSNDDARIPILAKMKVLLGNVEIQLKKWNRRGWNPPRYNE